MSQTPSGQYRQGDVLLLEIATPAKLGVPVARENGGLVLARGEATGHIHTIDDGEAALYLAEDGTIVLEARGPVTLRHQEHGPIAVPAGFYRVIRQREYEDDAAVRHVRD